MRYIISNNVALRSWKLVPCACYVRGHQYAQRLSREQFELLQEVRRRPGAGADRAPTAARARRSGARGAPGRDLERVVQAAQLRQPLFPLRELGHHRQVQLQLPALFHGGGQRPHAGRVQLGGVRLVPGRVRALRHPERDAHRRRADAAPEVPGHRARDRQARDVPRRAQHERQLPHGGLPRRAEGPGYGH